MTLTIETLQPGLYRLTGDVINSFGDKRAKLNFWRRGLWKKGTILVAEMLYVTDDSKHLCLREAGTYSGDLTVSQRNTALLALMLPHLEPVADDTLEAVLLYAREHQHRVRPAEVLEQLLQDKIIDLDQVRQAIEDRRTREKETDRGE